MQLDEQKSGDIVIVRPRAAQLNAPVAAEFRARIAAIVERGDRDLILDLSDVEFVDSTALGAIVAILKLVDPSGHLLLCNTRPTVQAMMEVTRMTRIFPLHDDVESARKVLTRSST